MLAFSREAEVVVLEPPTDSLSAWYRADDLALANGASVSLWPDLSGNLNDLSTVSGVANPVMNTGDSEFNGHKTVDFAGSNALFKAYPAAFPSGNDAISLYIVNKPSLTGFAVQSPVSWGQDGITGARICWLFIESAPSTWIAACDSFSSGTDAYAATAAPQIDSLVMATGETIATADPKIDGVKPAVVSAGSGGALNIYANPEIRVGGFAQTSFNTYVGRIAEILVYDKEHSAAETLQTLQYLSARYGITLLV